MIRYEWANAHPKISSMFTYKSVTLILQQNNNYRIKAHRGIFFAYECSSRNLHFLAFLRIIRHKQKAKTYPTVYSALQIQALLFKLGYYDPN